MSVLVTQPTSDYSRYSFFGVFFLSCSSLSTLHCNSLHTIMYVHHLPSLPPPLPSSLPLPFPSPLPLLQLDIIANVAGESSIHTILREFRVHTVCTRACTCIYMWPYKTQWFHRPNVLYTLLMMTNKPETAVHAPHDLM